MLSIWRGKGQTFSGDLLPRPNIPISLLHVASTSIFCLDKTNCQLIVCTPGLAWSLFTDEI